jgi:hypothetical protein
VWKILNFPRAQNSCRKFLMVIIMSHDGVTIDRVWIGNRNYWTLNTTRDYTLQITQTNVLNQSLQWAAW